MLKFIQGEALVETVENFQNNSHYLLNINNPNSICSKRNVCG